MALAVSSGPMPWRLDREMVRIRCHLRIIVFSPKFVCKILHNTARPGKAITRLESGRSRRRSRSGGGSGVSCSEDKWF
jgi:hypothetical protein